MRKIITAATLKALAPIFMMKNNDLHVWLAQWQESKLVGEIQ